MNILHNLVALYDSTEPDDTYHSAIRYILEHLDSVPNANIYDLAELTATSRTTLWRLVQKLGYKSYSEFKHELGNTLQKYTYINRVLPGEDTGGDAELISSYFSAVRANVEGLEQALVMDELHSVVDAVHRAGRVCFYVYGRVFSEIPFQANLAVDGKQTEILTRNPDLAAHAQTLDPSCFVFISSVEYSDTMDLEPVFITAKEKGATVFLMSGGVSRYTKYADFQIPFTSQVQAATSGMVNTYRMYMYLDIINMLYRRKYIDKL